ncbi:MAG: hypothetical protein GY714_01825 [Desulfobacterales bacterium]|nr:hypothetical protein [Desulfobacterales bacterium]
MQIEGLYTNEHNWKVIQQAIEERKDWVEIAIKRYQEERMPIHFIKELEVELERLNNILHMIQKVIRMFC